jgi:uncharacterized ubiquitin-like protein YukD
MRNKNSYSLDLDFIYNSILDNHPGVYNEEDPKFRNNLEQFYNDAKKKIISSKNDLGSKDAIDEFSEKFDDAHLWVSWKNISKKSDVIVTKRLSISQLSNDIPWISLPTFDLNISQEKDFEQLIKDISKFQTKKYIIFDLRGNQGGNSDYGSKIANALFGEGYAYQKRCSLNKKTYVDWRVIKGNLDHIASLLIRYPSSWLQNVAHGLKASIMRGKNYYREYSSESCDLKNNLTLLHTVRTKIIIIIDALNVSAALDFIDELKIMTTNLILVGQTTKADRLYMEVRTLSLPSGLGSFSFPIKVYRNRLRSDNQSYLPDIKYQDLNNILALQNFILTLIMEKKI